MAAQTATLTTASPTQVITLTSTISIIALSGYAANGEIAILAGHSAANLAPLVMQSEVPSKQPLGVFSIGPIPAGWVLSISLTNPGQGASVIVAVE